MADIKNIESQIKEWASKHLGDSFSFREHQIETITKIIYNVLDKDGKHTHIIEAPTGSGKSLLCIISAGVLSEYYKKKSYILCSDLYLYSQYETFINQYKLNFGSLKGQTGNYYCDKNGEDVRNGECRIAKLSWSKLYDTAGAKRLGFECAKYCTYIHARQKAQKSDVTLMTYQLYFYMINVVRMQQEKAPFQQRDVIFCDECHNIPSLVQNQYSPTIRHSNIDKLIELYKYNLRLQDGLFADEEDCPRLPWKNETALLDEFERMWEIIRIDGQDCHTDGKILMDYVDFFNEFRRTVEKLEDALAVKKRSNLKLEKAEVAMYKVASWYRNYCCFISDFMDAISMCGSEYLVKKIDEPTTDDGETVVSFNCVKEDYMCWTYLLSTAEHNVLMSATVGMKEAFDDNIGVKFSDDKESFMERIPSTFDFTNSPVIVNNRYKMSYGLKNESFPFIKQMIYTIVRQFKDYRGMIQTGSYVNAQEIFNDAPKDIKDRFQLYNSSKDKNWSIEMHKAFDNSVILGPTLTEGVDLPGDLLRFIVIAKIPYPNLADKLVTAKMKLFPKWYDSETANNIIQGIGRGNRSKDDWCVTYIIDGCFQNLYYKTISQFPKELRERIKVV